MRRGYRARLRLSAQAAAVQCSWRSSQPAATGPEALCVFERLRQRLRVELAAPALSCAFTGAPTAPLGYPRWLMAAMRVASGCFADLDPLAGRRRIGGGQRGS